MKVGQPVQRGAVIGTVGDAKRRIGVDSHLHFGINEGKKDRNGTPLTINPYPRLQNAQKSGSAPSGALPVGPEGFGGAANADMQSTDPYLKTASPLDVTEKRDRLSQLRACARARHRIVGEPVLGLRGAVRSRPRRS